MKKVLPALLATLFLCADEKPTLTYYEEVNGHTIETEWFSQEKDKNLHLEGKSSKTLVSIVCTPDYVMEEISYTAQKEGGGATYSCKRTGGSLELVTKMGDREIVKNYNVGRSAWVQEFGFGLRPFMASGAGSLKFYIINPKDLSMHKLVAKKEGLESITIGDKAFKVEKVKITLTGLKSLFWTAYAWFDTESGNMIMYKGNRGPNTPTTTITLKV